MEICRYPRGLFCGDLQLVAVAFPSAVSEVPGPPVFSGTRTLQ